MKVSFLMLLTLCIFLVPAGTIKAQSSQPYAATVQAGGNFFFSDAYPESIFSYSYGASFDYSLFDWGGLMFKVGAGNLNGVKRYASGGSPYSTNSNYFMLMPLGYLHATNIVFGVDEARWIDIKVIGGAGFMSSKYDVQYTKPDEENRTGTSNILALTAGGILELHFSDQWTFMMELSGIADFSNSIDGIWDESQGAAAYKGYDVVGTLEAGIKYRFGGDGKEKVSKGKYKSTQNQKFLPSNYKGFRGADGMEKDSTPNYKK